MKTIESVSILLLTKNAGPEFEQILDRIENQETEYDIEIVVVDSGSSDGTVERARSHADELIEIDPEAFHHSRTRNLAAEHASGDIYVYLTQDALPQDETWLESLLSPFTDENVGAVYGRQVAYSDAKPMDQFFYSYFYPEEKQRLHESDVEDRGAFYLEHIFISDVTAAIRAETFEDVSFDPDVSMSEDKDFAFRALASGYELVYEPSAVVYHSHDYSISDLFWRRYKDGKAFASIAGGGESEFVGEGVRYVLQELKFLISNGDLHWIPYALLYDFTYFLGFQIGKLHFVLIEPRA